MNNLPEEFDQPDYFLKNMQMVGLYYKDDLCKTKIAKEIIAKVPVDIATKYHLIPIFIDRGILVVATDTEHAFKKINEITKELNMPVKLLLSTVDNIKMALLEYYKVSNYRERSAISNAVDTADYTPLKRKINDMIQKAAELHASDIHLLPSSHAVYTNFRINGHMIDMTDTYNFLPSEASQIINIIKNMDTSGNADITKMKIPNSGSFSIRHGEIPIFVRISTVPIGNDVELQKVNLRLLPQNSNRITLDQIGYSPKDLQEIKKTLFQSATGLFINSGPTGSGKTTSLYAQMYYIEDVIHENLNIMCIENPIEIKEERFVQVQVKENEDENLDLSAEKILKVGLRSDPDIFLYGEIRDSKDATVAIEASTTGHRVFSTVHASDCVRTITRLLDLNVSKMSLLSELRMIISQRLVGVLCPECSHEHILTAQEKAILTPEEIEKLTAPGVHLKELGTIEEQHACSRHCTAGLEGRVPIDEYVIFDTALRDALLNQKSFSQVTQVLQQRNFLSMWEKGLSMASTGRVALSEIIHVIGKN